jgi:hypothetical protein
MNPEGPARNRALAIWQATTAAGATAGIIAGGLLTQYLGWRAVFLVNPPLIAVMLALAGRLPAGRHPAPRRARCGPGDGALAALIFGLSYGQQHGFTTVATIAVLAAAVVLGAGFVRVEQRAAAPMLPLAILAAPIRRTALSAMLLIGAVLAGYVYFTSLYLQRVQGFSPLATGLALIPSTVTVVLTSTLGTRRLLARFTVKQVLLAGLGAMAVGQLWLTQIHHGASYAPSYCPGCCSPRSVSGSPCRPHRSPLPAAFRGATRAWQGRCSPPASRSGPQSGSQSWPPPLLRARSTRPVPWWPDTGSRS